MSRIRELISFASWNYGAQLITVFAQFGYAGVTSRLVDDAGFGQYAIGLAVFALIGLIVNGGLGQTAGRMQELRRTRLSALSVYAIGLGISGALILFLGAETWSGLWGAPQAANAVRFLTLSMLVAPLAGLGSGLLRRQGRFKVLAAVILVANLVGMMLGLLAVMTSPGPAALLVSPVCSTLLQALATVCLNRKLLLGKPDFPGAAPDLRFSWSVTALSLVSYLNGNIGRWAVARGVGAADFGQWNRADVLTSVPMQQLQTAFQQAVYPEFRHDVDGNSRTRAVWTDMLVLVAWVSLPLSAAIAVIAPAVVPLLFGGGWSGAVALSAPLALVAGLQMITVTLGIALEATGRFRWIIATHLTSLLIHVCAAAVAVAESSIVPVIAGLFAATMVQHAVQMVLCVRANYLDGWRLLRGYLVALAFSAVVSAMPFVVSVRSSGGEPLAHVALVLVAFAVVAALVCALARFLPPVRIIRKYRAR